MDFQTFHRYNRLVRRGVTKPLACQHCDRPMTLRLGEEDKPVLYCAYCNVTVLPGLKMFEDINAVVKEWFE